MPKLIINEFKEAERIIEKGFTRNVNFPEVSLLAKYYRNKGYGFKRIEKLILELCHKHIPYFDEDNYAETIHKAIDVAKTYKIKENVNYVIITKSELESIKNIPSNYRKILFTMLVLAKKDKFLDVKVKVKERKEYGYYCNYKIESVADKIGIRLNEEQLNDFKYFADGMNNLISSTSKGVSFWRICFANDDSDLVIVVDDFENILKFLPDICEVCGEEIIDRKRKQKYCEVCKVEKEREKDREKKKRKYYKNKFSPLFNT
jgi:hypothetical protein